MSYLRFTTDLLTVPGKLDPDEMAFLAALAAQVPPGGQIVEIGPFYGRSTRVMARANPGALITSIDTFEDVDWTRRYAARHPSIPAFSEAAFCQFTDDLPNVSRRVGPSPQVAAGWTAPVDLYFEDAVHGNPVLAENLRFWTTRLRPGGIACGHDYTLRFPDIKREVDALAAAWNCELAVVGSLWALRKPGGPISAPPAPALTPRLSTAPQMQIRTKSKQTGLASTPSGYWCGAHLDADRLLWMQVFRASLPKGLRLEARVGHPEHGTSPWMPVGERIALRDANGKPLAFDRAAFRIIDDTKGAGHKLHIGYKVSARATGKGASQRSGTSQRVFDGAWARAPSDGVPLNAVTLALYETRPPDAQMAFPDMSPRARARTLAKRAAEQALKLRIDASGVLARLRLDHKDISP